MRLPARLAGVPLALVLALSLSVTACSGGDQERQSAGGGSGDATGSESPTEEPYLDVPEGVELTAQGTELEVGQSATVAYEPRQNAVGALKINVTSLEKAGFDLFEGFDVEKEARTTTPYFVRARVTNVGDTDLGGRPVPLYIVDGENRLIESSVFLVEFKPCTGSTFPKRFRNGDSMRACLVYLTPDKGELTAVSFRPDQQFDPITWTGKLTQAGPDKSRREDTTSDRKQGDRKQGDRKQGDRKQGDRKKKRGS